MAKNKKSLENLNNCIEVLKKELIEMGTEKGFTNHETIKHSQKLDKLLNKYQSLNK